MCDVIFELAIQFVLYRTPKTNIKGKGYKYFRTYTFLRKTVKQEGQDVNKFVIVTSFKDYNYNWLLYSPNVKKMKKIKPFHYNLFYVEMICFNL